MCLLFRLSCITSFSNCTTYKSYILMWQVRSLFYLPSATSHFLFARSTYTSSSLNSLFPSAYCRDCQFMMSHKQSLNTCQITRWPTTWTPIIPGCGTLLLDNYIVMFWGHWLPWEKQNLSYTFCYLIIISWCFEATDCLEKNETSVTPFVTG